MYQNFSEMCSNKYTCMPFNITSHTNIQFDLEKTITFNAVLAL